MPLREKSLQQINMESGMETAARPTIMPLSHTRELSWKQGIGNTGLPCPGKLFPVGERKQPSAPGRSRTSPSQAQWRTWMLCLGEGEAEVWWPQLGEHPGCSTEAWLRPGKVETKPPRAPQHCFGDTQLTGWAMWSRKKKETPLLFESTFQGRMCSSPISQVEKGNHFNLVRGGKCWAVLLTSCLFRYCWKKIEKVQGSISY